MKSPPPAPTATRLRRAFTLIELMLVITIVAILVALSLVSYSHFRAKAETVDTINKLKGMHAALSLYIVDKQTWPQEPSDDEVEVNDDVLWEWWKDEMKPYGIGEQDWYSTAHLRVLNRQLKESGSKAVNLNEMGKEEELKFPSIIPGNFDPGPTEPFRYEGQPWVSETGEYHGDEGIYTIMPSSAIHKMPTMSQMNAAKGKSGGK